MNTLLFLYVAFACMALVHELGHKVAAALCRVAVPAIQIGVGPHVLQRNWWRTRWTIGLLPLGGYTRVHGMLATDAYVPTRGDYRHLHPLQRAVVILGGPLGNVLLAMLLVGALAVWDGGTLGAAAYEALCAPFAICKGLVALWADAFGMHLPALDLRTFDGSWRGYARTLATGNIIVALLNLVPSPRTDGGNLLALLKDR